MKNQQVGECMRIENDSKRDQSIQDIMFEFRCMAFFKEMKRAYRYSEIGFMFNDLHKVTNLHVLRLVRKHKKEFNEKLDIKMMKVST